jgi:hypothetical protein
MGMILIVYLIKNHSHLINECKYSQIACFGYFDNWIGHPRPWFDSAPGHQESQ